MLFLSTPGSSIRTGRLLCWLEGDNLSGLGWNWYGVSLPYCLVVPSCLSTSECQYRPRSISLVYNTAESWVYVNNKDRLVIH